MHLLMLRIGEFRNLKEVELCFPKEFQSAGTALDSTAAWSIRSYAIIGQNGTGKSNLIEALITIFPNVDLDRDAAFDYTLEYEIRGHTARIQADTKKAKAPSRLGRRQGRFARLSAQEPQLAAIAHLRLLLRP